MSVDVRNAREILLRHDMDISMYDDPYIVRMLEKHSASAGFVFIHDYLGRLSADVDESRKYFGALNNSFSEFFRNPLTFAYLEQVVLPNIIAAKLKTGNKETRIWSAACAAGQEAYSMAILCDEQSGFVDAGMSCRIFATDINEAGLAHARRGIYDPASVRKTSLDRLQRHFSQDGAVYSIASRIKSYVEFSTFDLLESPASCPPMSIYGNFDIVFCSNILFYYNSGSRCQILDKVGDCLAPGAFLVCGESERDLLDPSEYREICPNTAVFQRKP